MTINASLLSFLTIDTGQTKEVFFAYLKELEETAPPDVYWYPEKGKDGEATLLWEEKGIRQWLAVGTDAVMKDLWETLLHSRSLIRYFGKAAKEVVFSFATTTVEKVEGKGSVVSIPGIRPCTAEPVCYRREKYLPRITFLIDEKNNCSFLEGYKHHPVIRAMSPAGLLPEDALYKYLQENIVAVVQARGLFYYFYEQKMDAGRRRVHGYIQADRQFRQNHRVVIRNLDGVTTRGQSDIDHDTGRWAVDDVGNDGEGQFLVENRQSGKTVFGENYFILRDIKINSNIVQTVITDLYNRQIHLSENDDGALSGPPTSIRWDATIYPDSRQAEIELSDKLTELLLALGTDIVISDPFFLGALTEKDGQVQFTSRSQVIFLNALLTAMGKGQIETFTMVGYWKRASNFAGSEKELFLASYRKMARLIQSTFKNIPRKQLRSFDLVFSKRTFHDRYWLNPAEHNGVCYLVSNSVNGPFEQKELQVTMQNEMDTFKEVSKIMNRMDDGEKINLLA